LADGLNNGDRIMFVGLLVLGLVVVAVLAYQAKKNKDNASSGGGYIPTPTEPSKPTRPRKEDIKK
jgi:hypothetical protein